MPRAGVVCGFFKNIVPTVYMKWTESHELLDFCQCRCLAEEIERKKARREVAIIAVLADLAEPIKTTLHQNSGVLYFCCSHRVP